MTNLFSAATAEGTKKPDGKVRRWLSEPPNPTPDAAAESRRFEQATALSKDPAVLTRLRPAVFAAYSAPSAAAINALTATPGTGTVAATPTLTVTPSG